MYSLERRRERYSAIYTWRILEGDAPNLTASPIVARFHPRRGRSCIVPTVSNAPPAVIKNARENSFAIRGPRLFNTLPPDVRNLTGCSVDTFKHALDKHLSTVPDEPLIPGLTQFRRVEGNSLCAWATYMATQDDATDPAVAAPQ